MGEKVKQWMSAKGRLLHLVREKGGGWEWEDVWDSDSVKERERERKSATRALTYLPTYTYTHERKEMVGTIPKTCKWVSDWVEKVKERERESKNSENKNMGCGQQQQQHHGLNDWRRRFGEENAEMKKIFSWFWSLARVRERGPFFCLFVDFEMRQKYVNV